LPSTGAAGLTETGGGGHVIGVRLGETVLAGAGLLASAELFAISEVFATEGLPQEDSARAMIAVPNGVASNASLPFARDAFCMP